MSAALPVAATRTASGGHHSSGGSQHKPRSDASSDDEQAMAPLKASSVRTAIGTAQVGIDCHSARCQSHGPWHMCGMLRQRLALLTTLQLKA
jgi:hypothetical protein